VRLAEIKKARQSESQSVCVAFVANPPIKF
jgi:hypothetical protein